jgi:DNA recombination protein RmuC
MDQIVIVVGTLKISLGEALAAGGAVALALFLALVIALVRQQRRNAVMVAQEAAREAEREQHIDRRMGEFAHAQAETVGRLQAMGESLAGRQAELARVLSERLDAVSHRVGQSLEVTSKQTTDRLASLGERLALIDSAQKNITDLSTQVTSLREVLANKQSRGAFGQARMEAIVQDGMPKGSYEFQYTLSNRTRPDCVVFLPDTRPLVIDAKFPLEAVTALRDARTEEDKKLAGQRLRQDVSRHIADIAEKYLLTGETQETALMFVPSESVYAELHDGFDDIVQKAYRARVVIVSPSLLMLSIQVMQQILKDARMREAADIVRTEVIRMMDDITRLRDRVQKLQTHFNQANDDMRQILISTEKIEKRAGKIEELEFDEVGEAAAADTVVTAPLRQLVGE